MANRNYASGGKIYSMHVKPVMVTATMQIDSSGDVSSFVGSMVASAEHISTGIYKIKLQDKTNFNLVYSVSASAQSPAIGLSGVVGIEVQHDPNTSAQISDGAELSIKCLDAAGALVDPADGSAINIMAIFSESSVKIGGE